jgi:hypothetical protein
MRRLIIIINLSLIVAFMMIFLERQETGFDRLCKLVGRHSHELSGESHA